MVRVCAVVQCTRNTEKLEKWKAIKCNVHGCNYGMGRCVCPPPFVLYPFPTERHDYARNIWINNINRKNHDGSRWEPSEWHRVCSYHFKDGKPTPQNPYPTESLGYTPINQVTHRPSPKKSESVKQSYYTNKRKSCQQSDIIESGASKQMNAAVSDHSYSFVCKDCLDPCYCKGCAQKQNTIEKLKIKIGMLEREKKAKESKKSTDSVFQKFLKGDKKVSLYTGLPNEQAFLDLYNYVHPRGKKLKYWRGKKRVVSTKNTRKFQRSPKKSKTSIKEELAMTLMKLRLNLSHEFLGDIFNISKGTVSAILNTWIKFLAGELKALVFWPDKISVQETIPPSLKSVYPQLRCTIDCSEIFIERPRHLQTQALTWSDYKKHNTVKFLVGIAPNGCITFLSKCWGGRATDRYITRASGFLDLVDPGDVILADRGFPIQEDLMMHQARLEIPPPSAGYEQQTQYNVRKTKKVANARIHVERAIGRLKCFKILQGILPISLVCNVDDILTICSAICNLQPPLVAK